MDEWRVEEEKAVKLELAERHKKQLLDTKLADKVSEALKPDAITVPLELGLRCLILQERMGSILTAEDRRRMADRLNVLLKAHRPFGVNLRVVAELK